MSSSGEYERAVIAVAKQLPELIRTMQQLTQAIRTMPSSVRIHY